MDGKKRPRFRLEVRRSTLKWYGCVTILFYTAGMAIFQNGLLHVGQYTREELALALKTGPGMMALSGWALLFRCAFGLCTVLLCAVYELLYDRKSLLVLIGCGVSTLYITAPLSGWLFWNYAGEAGKCLNKYIFYAFYPLHLLVFGVIAHVLAG